MHPEIQPVHGHAVSARRSLRRSASAAALLLATAALAQEPFAPWPGARYAADVPTFEEVLGYQPGERIASHAELITFLEALARARPRELRLVEYGRTWEGRRLVYAILGRPETIARLDEIESRIARLADPRHLAGDEAASIAESLPATVLLAYGVHGNEISSPDAALLVAYHLLAAEEDPLVESIRANVLVLIDPAQNPDGRDRFVDHFRTTEGLQPDPSPIAAEHDEPWPGGRTNHYLFDLNRDWFAVTQPETAGRIGLLRRWLPLVVVDLHEMSGNSTYFFAPNAAPANPHLTREQMAAQETFGRNNARWFDHFGFDYFTREVYDAFYPGYGDSWPAFYGAVAMTYEMASARGLVLRRRDGRLLSFREGIERHFVASLSTLETAAKQRRELWREVLRYRRSAVEEGERGKPAAYALPRRGDTSSVDKLAGLLVQQGVEVERSPAPLRACGEELPAGSYMIDLAQPSGRLVRTLLDPQVRLDEGFIEEQERRRSKRLSDQIYDVTAWSLPLMYGIEVLGCDRTPSAVLELAPPDVVHPGRVDGPEDAVAWIVPWGTTAAGRLLTAALRSGLEVRSPEGDFTIDGRTFPAGSLVFTRHGNPDDLPERLVELARVSGASVVASSTTWVDTGVSFGSRRSLRLHPPRIALAWDRPTAPYAAGAVRYILERQYGYPVTIVRSRTLATADLRGFDVLLLPDSGREEDYSEVLEGERLAHWVRMGGTLVALGGGAVKTLAGKGFGLLDTRLERSLDEGDGQPAGSDDSRIRGQVLASQADYLDAIRVAEALPDAVPGALVRADLDSDHWLTAGLESPLLVLVRGREIFSPLTLDRGTNAAVFAGPDALVASGHLWEPNRRQLAFKPFVMAQPHGRGMVIGFTADPTFRAQLDGLNLLLLNAIFRGAAHGGPVPP